MVFRPSSPRCIKRIICLGREGENRKSRKLREEIKKSIRVMGIGQRVEWLPFWDHVVCDYLDQGFANSRTLCQSKQLTYQCHGHCGASPNTFPVMCGTACAACQPRQNILISAVDLHFFTSPSSCRQLYDLIDILSLFMKPICLFILTARGIDLCKIL